MGKLLALAAVAILVTFSGTVAHADVICDETGQYCIDIGNISGNGTTTVVVVSGDSCDDCIPD